MDRPGPLMGRPLVGQQNKTGETTTPPGHSPDPADSEW